MSEMSAEQIAEEFRAKLGDKILGCEVRTPRRIYAEVAPEHWAETAMYLWGDRGARFNIASGMQTRTGFEVLYHFAFDQDGVILSVRVRIDEKEAPVLPSLADRIKAFNFIERELHDLLGIKFEGHPALVPLLRAEDWPSDLYPLRRTEPRAELDYEDKGRGI